MTPGPQGSKLWRLCSRQGSPELHCSRGRFQSFTLILRDKEMVPEIINVSDANQCPYEGTSPQSRGPHSPRGLQTTGQSRPTRALCTLLAQPQRLPSDPQGSRQIQMTLTKRPHSLCSPIHTGLKEG